MSVPTTQPPDLAFGGIAQPVVVVHAVIGLALCGATTHHVVVAYGYLRGVYRWKLARVYAAVTAGCYAATFLVGMVAYPSYRYFVRGLYFERSVTWASSLFDVKESVAALGLPLVLSVLLLSRRFEPDRDPHIVGPYLVLVIAVWLVSWFPAITGLLITMQRGVPS